MLSDSCHSGTMARAAAIPRAAARPSGEAAIEADVILISGCQDSQESEDGARNGAFTGALLKAWRGGKFAGDYRKLHLAIAEQLPEYQQPNYYRVGECNPAFDAQRPFTVGVPS